MLHELNSALLEDGTTLRTGVHEVHLEVVLLDGDASLDGVVVGCDILRTTPFPSRSVVEYSFLHLQPIGISIEGILVIDIQALEVDSNLLSHIRVRHTVYDNLPLRYWHIVNHDNLGKCLLPNAVLKVQCHLGGHRALLGSDLGELAVSDGVECIVTGSEYIVATLLSISLVGGPVSQIECEREHFIVLLLLQVESSSHLCAILLECKYLQVTLNNVSLSLFRVFPQQILLAV